MRSVTKNPDKLLKVTNWKLIKKASSANSPHYASALWELKEHPGIYLYKVAGCGWIAEAGERSVGSCPPPVQAAIKEQASEILFLKDLIPTRRQLIGRLEALDTQEGNLKSSLAELL